MLNVFILLLCFQDGLMPRKGELRKLTSESRSCSNVNLGDEDAERARWDRSCNAHQVCRNFVDMIWAVDSGLLKVSPMAMEYGFISERKQC